MCDFVVVTYCPNPGDRCKQSADSKTKSLLLEIFHEINTLKRRILGHAMSRLEDKKKCGTRSIATGVGKGSDCDVEGALAL